MENIEKDMNRESAKETEAAAKLETGGAASAVQKPVQEIVQNEGVRSFFTFCFFGTPLISAAVSAVIMLFYKVEDEMPQITAGISAFHRAEAEARGEVYVSPEEKVRFMFSAKTSELMTAAPAWRHCHCTC